MGLARLGEFPPAELGIVFLLSKVCWREFAPVFLGKARTGGPVELLYRGILAPGPPIALCLSLLLLAAARSREFGERPDEEARTDDGGGWRLPLS